MASFLPIKSLGLAWATATVIVLVLGSACGLFNTQRSLVLATTTSTYDSGLLDAILPPFEEKHNVKVRVVAVGTGQALAIGSRGDADVLLVHAPEKEEKFVADGFGTYRKYVMYNDFVILGPREDPARIRGLKDAAEAFKRIAQTKAIFASRGDESGTHTKEKTIWGNAGVDISLAKDWYRALGQGMGETLTAADEMKAYILSDRGTFLSRPGLQLEILVEGDELLFNPYHIMIVTPEKFPNVQGELARQLVDYLLQQDTQEAIGEFGKDKYGQNLFTPVNLKAGAN